MSAYKDLSRKDRALLLKRFIDTLVNDKYGPDDPDDLVLVRKHSGSNLCAFHPTAPGRLPSDIDKIRKYAPYPFMYRGSEAPKAIRQHGLCGFCLHWNYGHCGTKGLILIDIDEPRFRSELPKSLEIRSMGSGGYHRVYHTDGSIRPYWYKPKGWGTSKVNVEASRDHTILPGSVGGRGVYHVSDNRPIASITRADVPDALQP